MQNNIDKVLSEVQKVILGKNDVAQKILMAFLANGHVLLDDVPGTGKTTLALAFSKAMGLKYQRIQFTPDVMPSDIVGFSIFNKSTNTFDFVPGAVIRTNILLGDEINRTSSKTQSALLEAMEEHQVTVDRKTYPLEDPFFVIATQNNVGTAGTQMLPYAQMDRFLVRLSIGYPDFDSQVAIIKDRQLANPVDAVAQVLSAADVRDMQQEAKAVTVSDAILGYITRLTFATRENPLVEVGISPRGAIAVNNMAKACAYVKGRNYVIPEDVMEVFADVCAHRMVLSQKARLNKTTAAAVLADIVKKVELPNHIR